MPQCWYFQNMNHVTHINFNICPNILYVDANADAYTDAEARGIAIALLQSSAGALKTSDSIVSLILKGKFNHHLYIITIFIIKLVIF